MAKTKVKLGKLSGAELRVLHDFTALMIVNLSKEQDDLNKLLLCELSEILKRLAPKLVFAPTEQTAFNLKMQEALAFKLAGYEYDLSDFDDYSANVLLILFWKIDHDTT